MKKKIKLKKIKIGTRKYKMIIDPKKIKKYKKDHFIKKNEILFGYCDPANNEIILDYHCNKKEFKRTIIHEILHPLYEHMFGDMMSTDKKDAKIEVLSVHLFDLMIKNKKLFKYFLGIKDKLGKEIYLK